MFPSYFMFPGTESPMLSVRHFPQIPASFLTCWKAPAQALNIYFSFLGYKIASAQCLPGLQGSFGNSGSRSARHFKSTKCYYIYAYNLLDSFIVL